MRWQELGDQTLVYARHPDLVFFMKMEVCNEALSAIRLPLQNFIKDVASSSGLPSNGSRLRIEAVIVKENEERPTGKRAELVSLLPTNDHLSIDIAACHHILLPVASCLARE